MQYQAKSEYHFTFEPPYLHCFVRITPLYSAEPPFIELYVPSGEKLATAAVTRSRLIMWRRNSETDLDYVRHVAAYAVAFGVAQDQKAWSDFKAEYEKRRVNWALGVYF